VQLLVLRCLNFYSLKCINYLINFRPVLLGAPLQLGALSARLVRLWVNPALWSANGIVEPATSTEVRLELLKDRFCVPMMMASDLSGFKVIQLRQNRECKVERHCVRLDMSAESRWEIEI